MVLFRRCAEEFSINNGVIHGADAEKRGTPPDVLCFKDGEAPCGAFVDCEVGRKDPQPTIGEGSFYVPPSFDEAPKPSTLVFNDEPVYAGTVTPKGTRQGRKRSSKNDLGL